TGGMIDDAMLFKMNEHCYRLICRSDYTGIWLQEQTQKLKLNRVWIKSVTDQLHNLSIQGPKSRDLLKSLNIRIPLHRPSIDELELFRFTIGKVSDIVSTHEIPLLISRTGHTNELGFEIWCHSSNSVKLWNKIWSNGQNPVYNLKPLGLLALNISRTEAGFLPFDYNFDGQTDAIEADIGFVMDYTKQEEFIGKQALIERKDRRQRQFVGLELHCNDDIENASQGDYVYLENSDQQIGIVISSCKSPILNKSIALAKIDTEFSGIGNRVEIRKRDDYEKSIPAMIVKYPFYDPKK
ncbi:unnamed protein product, partial [Didymodactylos carnosus]